MKNAILHGIVLIINPMAVDKKYEVPDIAFIRFDKLTQKLDSDLLNSPQYGHQEFEVAQYHFPVNVQYCCTPGIALWTPRSRT